MYNFVFSFSLLLLPKHNAPYISPYPCILSQELPFFSLSLSPFLYLANLQFPMKYRITSYCLYFLLIPIFFSCLFIFFSFLISLNNFMTSLVHTSFKSILTYQCYPSSESHILSLSLSEISFPLF